MTLKDKILLYLIENPQATNKEIADHTRIKESHAKTEISKLKSSGHIATTGNGSGRKFQVLKEPLRNININKRERYERQLDFLEEIMFSDIEPAHRLEASAQHIRVLNKL
ncbi:hypothetical protein MFLO_14762 [Listeria floridensis FSL S10-1187]|uniref:Uncharacterized protein n=1 Tax=Listeria floridensis FSL S10-1187 TaxID=1265817 RepID=A0ABP3AWI8_9LIST|nr:winged helix-turn-helix domain-containing protein [Listeria floridensis]EUJ25789.1 hypothetical protein MFLO_14762 [Listeria floridensis FSL S10-1187]